MKNIVILTGAGISAESGISTFRDSGGLWEGHDIMEVASPQGWDNNPKLVLDFYNKRRKQAFDCLPNKAHILLAELEKKFTVTVITQNVDNLHEKGGSTNVVHLHGELSKVRSSIDEYLIYDIEGKSIQLGDTCDKNSQLRPHIVWFGEAVPMMDKAIQITSEADVLIVIGTSLVVYPAASLLEYTKSTTNIFVIDPIKPSVSINKNIVYIQEKATIGVEKLINKYFK